MRPFGLIPNYIGHVAAGNRLDSHAGLDYFSRMPVPPNGPTKRRDKRVSMKSLSSNINADAVCRLGSRVAPLFALLIISSTPSVIGGSAKEPAVDTYWGTQVVDKYRWLEDGSNPDVKEWWQAQNAATRKYLDALPDRPLFVDELKRLSGGSSSEFYGLTRVGERTYAYKDDPTKQQPLLVVLESLNDTASARVLFDPGAYDTTGLTTIDFFEPTTDGRLVAMSLSQGGSEDGALYFLEVATGKLMSDVIPRVAYPTGGGSVCWNADNSGVYYTRYPAPGERPEPDLHFFQQLYFHRLGSDIAKDTYEIGKEFPRIAEVALSRSFDGQSMLLAVANGDGGEYAHYLKTPNGWTQLTKFEDKITDVEFGHDQALYMMSIKTTPRGSILRMPLADPELGKTATVVPQGAYTISSFTPGISKLFAVETQGGPSRLVSVDVKTGKTDTLPGLPIASTGKPLWLGNDRILFTQQSFIKPSAYYSYDAATDSFTETALRKRSLADYSDVEVVRETAVSKDGTEIPMNIIRRKGTKLDGSNPTILNGYGGFGIVLGPGFSGTRSIWLANGGVYVIANLRGGGEYGEDWHQAGSLTRKQNVFDDFLACAEHLIKVGYTNPQKLAIQGGSNGGLLMGAALTQRPDLFRAVVTRAGIYDMLRVELSPNGHFNTTEFGTVKDSLQFEALYAYSPYHRVKEGTRYPAVLFTVGENDGRVDPMQSRKMAARLQEATTSGDPILLRVSTTSGHGQGSSLTDEIELEADVWSFVFDQLGMRYHK